MRVRSFLPAAALVAASLSFSSAYAATIISIGIQQAGYNGGAIYTAATDGGTATISGSGYATFAGAYGTYNFNSITATGAPIRNQGNLSTTSVNISNNNGTTTPTAGTIYVYITEQGLTSPSGATSFLSSFTSNTFTGSAVSVVESSYYSNSNALFGGTSLASQTFTAAANGGLGTDSFNTLASLTGPYSETVKYAFTMGSTAASVNDTIDLTATAVVTPEPSSLVLLGTGLLGTAATFLRRRKLIA